MAGVVVSILNKEPTFVFVIIIEKVRLLFRLGQIWMIVQEVLSGTSSAFHYTNDNELRQSWIVHVRMDYVLNLKISLKILLSIFDFTPFSIFYNYSLIVAHCMQF